jgi:hypothetical protein
VIDSPSVTTSGAIAIANLDHRVREQFIITRLDALTLGDSLSL